MMESLFIEVLNMSYMGSIVIGIILLLRIVMKKVPKTYSYYLWLVPLIRLMVPFNIESVISLIPMNPKPIPSTIIYSAVPQITTGVTSLDKVVSDALPVAEGVTSLNPLQIWVGIGIIVWIIGVVTVLAYGGRAYGKLQRSIENAFNIRENVYVSSEVISPFVCGLTKPKIYMPESLKTEEIDYVLRHEQMHIRRWDHIFRFVSFLVLCIHWFNPLVWVAYYVSERDMEMACDEAVVGELGLEVKSAYSQTLLNMTVRRGRMPISVLAFGEGDTKGRVKNILKFRKPTVVYSAIIILGLGIIGIGLLMNPLKSDNTGDDFGSMSDVISTYTDKVDTSETMMKSSEVVSTYVYKIDDELEAYKGSYVGDNSAVGNILTLLNVEHKGFALMTEQEPYSIKVFMDEDELSEEHFDKMSGNTSIMFYLISNVSYIEYINDEDQSIGMKFDRKDFEGPTYNEVIDKDVTIASQPLPNKRISADETSEVMLVNMDEESVLNVENLNEEIVLVEKLVVEQPKEPIIVTDERPVVESKSIGNEILVSENIGSEELGEPIVIIMEDENLVEVVEINEDKN